MSGRGFARWQRQHAPNNRKLEVRGMDQIAALYDGRLSYPFTCAGCGHMGLVKLTDRQRETARLVCSQCGQRVSPG